jgi:catechol 2,3-dioxygenase-like lactoylglutathione lyase family enzyme
MMIAVKDIAYVRVPTPDLDAMENFLTDFGMSRTARTQDRRYMRGSGTQQFIHVAERAPFPGPEGIGFWAKSLEDLHSLAADTGKAVEENTERVRAGRIDGGRAPSFPSRKFRRPPCAPESHPAIFDRPLHGPSFRARCLTYPGLQGRARLVCRAARHEDQ